ncbi:glutamate 5-kinase [Roseibacterium beibuensis]|uniref:glutamate 5-kinase n=1 Tax=[Roseibacterium] beibuensis TaxID=1193142 RepID=UPI00217D4778|nr:glutamate 5-kinase [Roseibacterium beibuensis]MCS6624549.1 glutamate 5-kinase [Roseibacterium beibuensis]
MTLADPPLAATAIAAADRIVIKIGSSLLVDRKTNAVDLVRLRGLAADIAGFKAAGKQVLVVSSGAVALGRRRLGSRARGAGLEKKQAAAAAGQSMLMHAWESVFDPHDVITAQILLTRDDTETRRRWLNARATVGALLDMGAVPIVNENDTIVTDQIKYGDNDRLAARVAQMISADLLVLLSDVDGLYTADPRVDPEAEHIPYIETLTPEIEAMATGANAEAGVGTGGMATKLMAARIAAEAGCATLIAQGKPKTRGARTLEEGRRCTLIAPATTVKAAYKQWIGGSLATRGRLTIDKGCARALTRGKSLLAVGILSSEGDFSKGDPVEIFNEQGVEIARGLVRYDDNDVSKIIGVRSAGLKAALGYAGGPVVIHADDLALRETAAP